MRHNPFLLFALGITLGAVAAVLIVLARSFERPPPTPPAQPTSSLVYTFNVNGTLEEAASMDDSSSPYFWLDSGAYLIISDGVGETVQGALPLDDRWRKLYAKNNPRDTDDGYYPQNLFRLVTRSSWGDASQQVSFRIAALENTDTPNRDGYSGVLLFSRYQDGNNLYYAGLRDDGTAVIKKKVGGVYYTLAQVAVFGNAAAYNKFTNPSFLPQRTWMALRLTTQTAWDNSVELELYLDRHDDGHFVPVVLARDTGVGGPAFLSPAHVGIRTDYLDVQFKNFKVEAL